MNIHGRILHKIGHRQALVIAGAALTMPDVNWASIAQEGNDLKCAMDRADTKNQGKF